MVERTPQLDAVLADTSRRASLRSALQGAFVGVLALFAWVALSLFSDRIADLSHTLAGKLLPLLFAIVIGAITGWLRSAHDRQEPARTLEPLVPGSNNLLVTAEELQRTQAPPASSVQAPEGVKSMVLQRAERLAGSVDVSALIPLQPSMVRLAGALVGWAVLAWSSDRITSRAAASPGKSLMARVTGDVAIQRVAVRVTPPSYTKNAESTLRDPQRVDALAGSTMTFTIGASADSVIVSMRDSTHTLAKNADGSFALTLPAVADGYVAFEPRGPRGESGARRMIGITVRADEAPRVRIAAPAKDMIVPDSNRTIDVRIEADDDLALSTLKLRYTKVSGSGERFTFTDGEIPVTIARAKPTEWTARAALALAPLLQEGGDVVVYRAVATDSRPGSPAVESDAYIAELAAPGGVASLGFAMDPDEDRYALSQQMVILKTERLIAKKATTAPAALAEEAAQLAGEQRRVRAEFVFMMGGEFAQEVAAETSMDELDESHEAESESDLAAGRMVNRGRTALLTAVRSMSRAATALTEADLTRALTQEKAALKNLQEAFARSRFLMRALSQREQLDMARRMTGKLDSIATGRTPIPEGERNARQLAWRDVLRDLVVVAQASPIDAQKLSLLAERVLRVDASLPASQRLAAQLSTASTSASTARARVLIDSAATGLTALLGSGVRPSTATAATADVRRLQSELNDALRGTSRDASRANARPDERR